MFRLRQSSIVCLVIVLLAGALTAACRSVAQPRPTEEPAAVATTVPQPTAIATPASLAAAPTARLATPIATSTVTASATPLPPQTPTATPLPCPTPLFMLHLYDRARPLPLDVSMQRAHFADDGQLFVTVENWVGVVLMTEQFDVTDPGAIDVAGFVQLPDLPPINDIAARDNLVFVSAGSSVLVVNAAHACWLTPIATVEFPFTVQSIELEEDRLYVGGIADEQLHIEVLNLSTLPIIDRLGNLTLDPVIWSVVGEPLLTYDERSATVTVLDVSNLEAVTTRPVALPLEPAWQSIGEPQLVDDALSLLVWDKGLGSFSGLLEPEATIVWHEMPYYFPLENHTAQKDALFVISNWGDAGSNSSSVWVTKRDNQDALMEISLYPHFPVYHYYAISDDIVFAFSDYSLIVIDLTAPVGQEIVRTYPLRGRLD